MRLSHYLILGLLFVVMSSALMCVQVYDQRQSEITREGNHLLTQNKVAFSGTAEEARSLIDESLGHYSIYRDLDDGGTVRAVESDRLDLLDLPVYEGRSFRRGEQGAALVGAEVPIRNEDGTNFYDINGASYEVIGRLGRESRSLVASDVIIADRGLVEAADPDTGVTIDGPAMKQQAALLPSHKVKNADASVNRRASVDLVSQTIGAVVYVVVAVCAIFTGVLAGQFARQSFRVGFLVGRSPMRMLALAVSSVFVAGVLSVAASLCAGELIFAEVQADFAMISIAPVPIAVMSFIAVLLIDFTEVRKWR